MMQQCNEPAAGFQDALHFAQALVEIGVLDPEYGRHDIDGCVVLGNTFRRRFAVEGDLDAAFISLLPEQKRRGHEALVVPPRQHEPEATPAIRARGSTAIA